MSCSRIDGGSPALLRWSWLLWLVVALLAGGCVTTRLEYKTFAHLNSGMQEEGRSVRLRLHQLSEVPVELWDAGCEDLVEDEPGLLGEARIYTQSLSVPPEATNALDLTRQGRVRWLLVVPNYFDCRPDQNWWALVRIGPFARKVAMGFESYTITLPDGQKGWLTNQDHEVSSRRRRRRLKR